MGLYLVKPPWFLIGTGILAIILFNMNPGSCCGSSYFRNGPPKPTSGTFVVPVMYPSNMIRPTPASSLQGSESGQVPQEVHGPGSFTEPEPDQVQVPIEYVQGQVQVAHNLPGYVQGQGQGVFIEQTPIGHQLPGQVQGQVVTVQQGYQGNNLQSSKQAVWYSDDIRSQSQGQEYDLNQRQGQGQSQSYGHKGHHGNEGFQESNPEFSMGVGSNGANSEFPYQNFESAKIHQHLWNAAIVSYENSRSSFLCAGFRSKSGAVITSASCFKRNTNPSQLRIVFAYKAFQHHNVKSIHIHPNYIEGLYYNDIALLTLEKPFWDVPQNVKNENSYPFDQSLIPDVRQTVSFYVTNTLAEAVVTDWDLLPSCANFNETMIT